VDKAAALERFLTGVPRRLEPATGDVRLAAVVVEVDEATGRATRIRRLMLTGD
jgi:hypothetical protein